MSVRKRSVAKVVGDITLDDSERRTKGGTTRDRGPRVGRASVYRNSSMRSHLSYLMTQVH
jgi:hypothetical protein